jgi:hypothetical protein
MLGPMARRRRWLVLSTLVGALVAWRQRKVAENERRYGPH